MIKFIKMWCEGIIVAIIISIIIELLLPDGNNKKYVKVVIGIYILFVILNPLIENFNTKIDIEGLFENNVSEVSLSMDNNIKDVFISGIEEDIKSKLIEQGYEVLSVSVSVDKNYENLESIKIKLLGKNENIVIEPIVIGNVVCNEENFVELKKYISEEYEISSEKIKIYTK